MRRKINSTKGTTLAARRLADWNERVRAVRVELVANICALDHSVIPEKLIALAEAKGNAALFEIRNAVRLLNTVREETK